jgi:hypothetical protein
MELLAAGGSIARCVTAVHLRKPIKENVQILTPQLSNDKLTRTFNELIKK